MIDKVYKIRGGTIKQANRKFNTTSSEYEITFNRDSTFDIVADSEAPKVAYNFRKIEEIESIEPQSIIDVLAVVHDVQPLGSVTVKSGSNAGNQIAKRDVSLLDTGGKTIKLTLWDDHKDVVTENDMSNPVIAIKGVRVSDFNGRSLSTTRSSMLEMNPDFQEAHLLKGWYECNGKNAVFQAVGGGMSSGSKDSRKTISQIKGENLGNAEKPDYFTVRFTPQIRAWVTYFKHDGTWNYPANPETKKKVFSILLAFDSSNIATHKSVDRSLLMGTHGSMRAHSRPLIVISQAHIGSPPSMIKAHVCWERQQTKCRLGGRELTVDLV
eukprot:448394-Hanusia_phi.AAC.3